MWTANLDEVYVLRFQSVPDCYIEIYFLWGTYIKVSEKLYIISEHTIKSNK